LVGWLVGYVIRLYCFSSATRKRAEGRKVEFHKIESIFFHEVESQNKSKDRNTKRIKRLNQKIESQDRIKRLNHKIKSIFSQDQITRSKVFFHKIKSQDQKYFFSLDRITRSNHRIESIFFTRSNLLISLPF